MNISSVFILRTIVRNRSFKLGTSIPIIIYENKINFAEVTWSKTHIDKNEYTINIGKALGSKV